MYKIRNLYMLLTFPEGAVDIFDDHSILNECDQFDMKNSPGSSIVMTLMHSGKLMLLIYISTRPHFIDVFLIKNVRIQLQGQMDTKPTISRLELIPVLINATSTNSWMETILRMGLVVQHSRNWNSSVTKMSKIIGSCHNFQDTIIPSHIERNHTLSI